MVHAFRSEVERLLTGTGVPHRWQNRAWDDRSARQAVHARACKLAPQELQKLPDAEAPQEGQVV
jgi:hypothetical protein